MLELLKTALRLPFATMTGLSDVLLGSLRQIQHAIDLGLEETDVGSRGKLSDARTRQGDAHTARRNDASNPHAFELCCAKARLTQSQISSNSKGKQMSYDKSDYDSDFFSDRNYVKTYEVTVTCVGEGSNAVLLNETHTTTQDTDRKCLENDHRDDVVNSIIEAVRANDQSQLPEPWRVNLPSLIKSDGTTLRFKKNVEEELDRYVEAHVTPIARNKIRVTNEDRRQSKALEGIESVIGDIKEKGLKTREY